MSIQASKHLKRLQQLGREFGETAAAERLESLCALEVATLPGPEDVLVLHEALCFVRAFPDDPSVLAVCERMLAAFGERKDLAWYRDALEDTGIAGTALHAELYWFTVDWLSQRWPQLLSIDWESYEDQSKLEDMVYALLEEHETLSIEGPTWDLHELIDGLRAPGETDAVYMARWFRGLSAKPLVRESVFDGLGIPMRIGPHPDRPSRTQAAFEQSPIEYQTAPMEPPSGSVPERIQQEPVGFERVSTRYGRELVELGRWALITRGRDLFAFMHADPRDVWIADFGAGFQYAFLGLPPERRHLLYGQYVFLALQNGVPVGYSQACTLFDSAEINLNVFDTFRNAEASRVFTTSLALARYAFEADAFDISPQQLGEGNPEALATGAWWFYYKHGFRPRSGVLESVVRREVRAKERDPRHRSSMETLEELAARHLYYFMDRERAEVVCRIDLGRVGRNVAHKVGRRVGASGEEATKRCAVEAERLLGVKNTSSWSPGERLAWKRWGPLVVALPQIEDWSRDSQRDLVAVIRAKGGPCEMDYVHLFHEHEELTAAILQLARTEPE